MWLKLRYWVSSRAALFLVIPKRATRHFDLLAQLGQPFDAKPAMELGLVTHVVPDEKLLATAAATAQKLAEKPAGALLACKRLMRRPVRDQLEQAAKLENEEYSVRLRSADAKEAFTAFLEKRQPDFTRKSESVTAA